MPDTVDDLLASAAPPVSLRTPDAEAALAAMVAESRRAVALERHRRIGRRAVGATAVVALMAVGTAAAAGVLPRTSQSVPPWNDLTDKAAATAQVFEWTSTHPVGKSCVERLTGWGLTDAEVAAITETLSDPGALLAKDDGAVRREFVDRGWANDSAEDTAAIDAAYAEVARLDLADGRAGISDDQLTGDFITDRYDELYNNVYWRLVLDGIGAGPHGYHEQTQAMQGLAPETGCEVPGE